jgi:large subunit ribosomal protein L9
MAKIILTQEVSRLGSAGDVVEVKDGYARNYLLPQGVAIRWTKGAEKEVESIRAARAKRAARDLDHAAQIKGKLEASAINLKVRAGQDGRLFGAVTVADIAAALEGATGESIDKRTIAVGNPIKTLGNHSVAVRLHEDVTAAVTLNVVPA